MSAVWLWLWMGCGAPEGLDPEPLAQALALAAQVDGPGLMTSVQALVDVRAQEQGVVVGHIDSPLLRVESARWLTSTLEGMGFSVVAERTVEHQVEVVNLYVDIPGTSRPEELVLLTAHYDSLFSGADDNASGLAVLVQAAELLQSQPAERTVRVLFFDMEEHGLMGAQRYFRDHRDDAVVGVVNLDGVGFASSEPGSQRAPTGLVLPDVGDFMGVIADSRAEQYAFWSRQIGESLQPPLPVSVLLGPGDHDNTASAAFHRSDHSIAWVYGLPALFLTDTANYRNANYHTIHDTPDTLNPDFLASAGQLVVGLVYAIAEAE